MDSEHFDDDVQVSPNLNGNIEEGEEEDNSPELPAQPILNSRKIKTGVSK